MLLIRDRQIQAFRAAGRERLERDLAGHLIEFFPKHTEFLGEKQLRKVVQHGVMSARNHEFRTDYETFLYVDLMFMLGGEFDRDPQLPWVSGFLEPRNGHPLGRIEGLHDRAMEYFDAVAGIDNEHWVRALVRARNFNLPSVETAAASAWAEEIERTLEKLYPEKFRYQGDAVRRFIEAEIAAAADVRTAAGDVERIGPDVHDAAGEIGRAAGAAAQRREVIVFLSGDVADGEDRGAAGTAGAYELVIPALDFRTGKTVYSQLAGNGSAWGARRNAAWIRAINSPESKGLVT
jgi:hypothetical protein